VAKGIWRPSDRRAVLGAIAKGILDSPLGDKEIETVPCTRCGENPVLAPSDINIDPVCRSCLSDIWHGASATCPDGKGGIRHLALTQPIYAAIHHLEPSIPFYCAAGCGTTVKVEDTTCSDECAEEIAFAEDADRCAGTHMDHSNLRP
jgi:hypothetical protein